MKKLSAKQINLLLSVLHDRITAYEQIDNISTGYIDILKEIGSVLQSQLDEILPKQTKLFADLNETEKKILKQHESILQEAHRIVNERVRESDREDPVEGFTNIAAIASTIRNKNITPRDATAIMMAVKLSREQYAHKRDNLVDLAGYTQIDYLLAEAGYE